MEFLDIQEAYIKDEHRNLKRELIRYVLPFDSFSFNNACLSNNEMPYKCRASCHSTKHSTKPILCGQPSCVFVPSLLCDEQEATRRVRCAELDFVSAACAARVKTFISSANAHMTRDISATEQQQYHIKHHNTQTIPHNHHSPSYNQRPYKQQHTQFHSPPHIHTTINNSAKEEVKRIQSVPLVIGQFLEAIDNETGIISSTTGQTYYVRILSTIDRELLKTNSSIALHRHSNAVVDTLPPEADVGGARFFFALVTFICVLFCFAF
jgi:hypothetical protein